MPVRYANPVWDGYFADPFVLKIGAEYYAYGTSDPDSAGRQFQVLRSADLANWAYVGNALTVAENRADARYWAPEVASGDAHYYLYYSCSPSGADQDQRIGVAISEQPAGPFRTINHRLLDVGFSIDPHPFRDPRTGERYLFFAMDWLDQPRPGTGVAVVRMAQDMTTILGAPQAVVRASQPWQIYARDRHYVGRVWERWYCVEGPAVQYHAGRYWCMYSGGCWNSENYGIGFAVAEDPMGPWRDETSTPGPCVLRGIPGRVIGPGHHSIVAGPNDGNPICVYHAWDGARSARRMCIDPLYWTADGPRCDGPSVGEAELERSLAQN